MPRTWLAALALVVSGCAAPVLDQSGPSTEDEAPARSPPSEGLPRISITVEPGTFRQGQDARVVLVLNNTTERPFRYDAPGGGACQHLQAWTTWEGHQVPFAPPLPPGTIQGCTSAITSVVIAPGERVGRVLVWNGSAGPERAAFLEPGVYRIDADAPAPGPWDIHASVNVTLLPGDSAPVAGHEEFGGGVHLVAFLRERAHSGLYGVDTFPNSSSPGPPPSDCQATVNGSKAEGATCAVRNQSMNLRVWGGPDQSVPWTVRATWPREQEGMGIHAKDQRGQLTARWSGEVAPWAGWAVE